MKLKSKESKISEQEIRNKKKMIKLELEIDHIQ